MSGLVHTWTAARTPTRVVVMGSRGFVGQAIIAELAHHAIPYCPISSVEVDLLAPGAEEALAGRLQPEDAFVIVSALTPDRGKDTATFMRNLRMMEAACAALRRQPVAHVVNIGSDAVYPDDASLVDEAMPAAPSGFHGMMHAAREVMLRATVAAPVAFLRPSLLYGAADTHNGYGPNRFRRSALKEKQISLFGGGEEKRDHVHVSDLAHIVRRVIERRSVGVLNVATGQSATFRQVADHVAAQFASPIAIIEQPRSGGVVTHRHFAVGACLQAFPDFWAMPLADGIALAHREAAHG